MQSLSIIFKKAKKIHSKTHFKNVFYSRNENVLQVCMPECFTDLKWKVREVRGSDRDWWKVKVLE